ncbi:carboxypeptidase-like regulatory domain-containing protein [Niabella sp. W65]|nr:carboxypeptidase-like regulatory domain-containing protein [Niabella sp. W65]MCH7368182.1 carboxypeptidase-like regulatory domain-containing protein [Niabella sp. W65]ULT43794.1 carboxypeptidase-like regulatory domain-containing protein [Niabella sp. I65]
MNAQLAGKVVNENNDPLPGASVVIKGTTQGTTTDGAGIFNLSPVPKIPFTITVSSVNYAVRNVTVRNIEDSLIVRLQVLYQTDTVVITSRRRREVLQDVPINVSVVGGKQIEESGAFNITRVKEIVPSLQMYTSIRGTRALIYAAWVLPSGLPTTD